MVFLSPENVNNKRAFPYFRISGEESVPFVASGTRWRAFAPGSVCLGFTQKAPLAKCSWQPV